jgi:spermidine synthase
LLGAALRAYGAADAQAVGRLAFWNTLGAALGPLIAGLLLLPSLGAELSLLVLMLGYGAIGGVLLYGSALGLTVRTAALSAFALGVAFFPFGQDELLVRASARRWMTPGDRIVTVRETALATLTHIRHGAGGLTLFEQLATNAYSMSVNDFAARRYMELFVVLPAALQERTERALVIGYGIGNTIAALTALPEVKRVDVVDISSELVALARTIPTKAARHPLTDPRVRVHIEDGRFFLAASRERWDLITGEPPPPIMAGVASLYSREHFELMRARLAPGGMATYWLPMMNISAATGRSIIAAFCGAFEDCTLWHASARNLMLVGTAGGEGRGPVSEARFTAQWDDPKRLPGLRSIGLELPGQLGALFIGDAPFLRAMTKDDPPLVDGWPKRMFRPYRRDERDEWLWSLRDTRAARTRFATSAFVRRHFPARWQHESQRQFENQRLLNDLLFPGDSPARQTAVLEQVLSRTPLTLPVLLLCGSDPDVQAALDRRPPAERDAAQWALHRAAGHLARRDFAAANEALAKTGDDALPLAGLRESVAALAARTPRLELPAKPW